LNLSIKNVATSDIQLVDVDVDSPEWKVNIPTHVLQTVGPHIITIESFEDSSSCSPSLLNSNRQSFRIDVAETAAIVPFDRREDWCVGDVLQYQLEGNAPWRVELVQFIVPIVGFLMRNSSLSYRFNGKSISATSKIPKFSRVAEKAGVFEIIAVAHQQTSCQSTVGDMKLTIRDLPSARVSHGNSVYEDLREGPSHSAIWFTLLRQTRTELLTLTR
jgi:nucleoporin POM152